MADREAGRAATDAPLEGLPLPVSGLVRGAFTGAMTALLIASGGVIYATVLGEDLDEALLGAFLVGYIGAIVGAVVGAVLGVVVGTLLLLVRRRVSRLGPWAGLTTLALVAPVIWRWWFERNALPFEFERDAGAVIALPLVAAALATVGAWTVPAGQARTDRAAHSNRRSS